MKPVARSIRAFSLVEVTLAIGVFAVLALALLGLLGGGLQSAQNIQTDYQTSVLIENLSARFLLEPDFPFPPGSASAELFLDESGLPVPQEQAQFQASFRRTTPPHWSGDFLQAVHVDIRLPGGRRAGSFILQRAVAN